MLQLTCRRHQKGGTRRFSLPVGGIKGVVLDTSAHLLPHQGVCRCIKGGVAILDASTYLFRIKKAVLDTSVYLWGQEKDV
jgi:hypothetical protein